MEDFFRRRSRVMPPNNTKQAMLPVTAEVIDNPIGTACGFALDIGRARFFFTPGVPRELRRMLEEQIIPRLLAKSGLQTTIRLKRFHSYGLGESHVDTLLARSDQALQILGRYRTRLDTVMGSLSALEVEDLVTVRDVATVLQRAEMVRRIAEEIEGYVIELGADGRLVLLQLEEAMGGVEDDRRLVAKDYFVDGPDWDLVDVMVKLADLDTESLLDLREVASLLHLPADVSLDAPIQPRGFRLLHKIPRIPEVVADHVVERFSNLQKIMRAGVSDLVEVEGVGEARGRAIKEGLSRLAETSILERYV